MRKKAMICIIAALTICVTIIAVLFYNKKTDFFSTGEFTLYGWYSNTYALCQENGIMCVKDYSTGECTAFCTQPDCTHQKIENDPNSKCTAVPPKDYLWYHAFNHNDYVYEIFFSTNKTLIYRAEKDGTNRVEIASSDKFQPDYDILPVLSDTKLIFLASSLEIDNDTAEIVEHKYLIELDLSNSKLSIISDLSSQLPFKFMSTYVYENKVYVLLRFEDRVSLLCCEDSELREVYSNTSIGIGRLNNNGLIFSIINEDGTSKEIDVFSVADSSVTKICDVSGYVNSIWKYNDGVFFCTDSSADGTFDIGNTKKIFYNEGKNTTECIRNTDNKKWDLHCVTGEKVILFESNNSGEWEQQLNMLCVCAEDIIKGDISNAVYLNNLDTSNDTPRNQSTSSVFNEYGQADFPVEEIDADESFFYEKTKIVWLTNYSYNVDSAAIQNEVNSYLDKNGYDIAVEFINHSEVLDGDFSLMSDYYKQLVEDGQQIDIFNSGMGIEDIDGIDNIDNTYKTCIENGSFIPLNNYFETDIGNQFYSMYPEWYWDTLKYSDGFIYGRGLLGLGSTPLCVMLNKQAIDKYSIDISDYKGTFDDLESYLEQAYKGSKMPQLVMPSYVENYYEYCGFINYDGIFYNTKSECFENIFENESVIDYLKLIEKYKNKGYIVNDENTITLKTAIFSIGGMNSIYPEFENAIIISDTYAGDNINMVTGVASSSKNPEKAFELLALISCDKELSDLIYNGIEGRNYIYNNTNQKVQNISAPAFSNWLQTPSNPIITDRSSDDNPNFITDYANQSQHILVSPLQGFDPDDNEVMNIDSIARIYKNFYGLFYGYYGEYESLDEALSSVNDQLKEAGIVALLNELNTRYNEWK